MDGGQRRAQSFLDSILMGLGNSLSEPEEPVVKQDDDMDENGDGDPMEMAIYFIKGTGTCRAKIKDHMGRERFQPEVLGEGDHFGEVALIYNSRRSATVISSDYNTFARLESGRFRQVIMEFPEWEVHLKANAIKSYRDKKIQFILRMLRRVEYLANFDDGVLFDLMFKLEQEKLEKKATVLDS